MLITIDDYKKYYGVNDNQEDLINNLLRVALQFIEETLGYTLEMSSRHEKVDYTPRIYLMCRPVVLIESLKLKNGDDVDYEFIQGNNFIDIEKKCCDCCNSCPPFFYITYTAGYTELPEVIKYLISSLVQSMLDSMSEESRKYTSYKIDTIAYGFRDFMSERQSEINNIVYMLR